MAHGVEPSTFPIPGPRMARGTPSFSRLRPVPSARREASAFAEPPPLSERSTPMAIHTIPVRLIVRRGMPPHLEVSVPKGITRVIRKPRPQTIRWLLQHHGSSGRFNALDDAISPGFLWISPPFPGIFGSPKVGDRGQSLTLLDDHNLEEKIGTWYYRLSATIDGVVYRTRFESPYPARVRPARSSRMLAATTSSSTVTSPAPGPIRGYDPRSSGNPTIKNR